jgi:hypothetical protein
VRHEVSGRLSQQHCQAKKERQAHGEMCFAQLPLVSFLSKAADSLTWHRDYSHALILRVNYCPQSYSVETFVFLEYGQSGFG